MHSNNINNTKNMHHPGYEFSLFVGDLPPDCSDDKLQRLFQSKFKSVRRVQIIRNEDGTSRCFGFIRFEDRADFQAALSQEMKIGNNTLRLDKAHNHNKNRSRYSSFNSSGSNNSNHHNHHHHHFNNNNNPHHPHHHHHHHNQQHHHHQIQQQQQQHQQQQHPQQQQQHPQQSQHGSQQSHHSNQSQNTTATTNNNNNNNNNNNVNNKTLMTDLANVGGQQNQPSANNQTLPQVGSSNIGVALPNPSITTTTSATTTMSNSSQNHTSNAVINNHHNLSASQQLMGPDLRGHMPTSLMDTSHLLGGDASMVQPTNLYGHVYPYGPPPPFGYMHPPPQPNPVIPISAVPPAPSNQASPSSGLSQQHTLTASSANRYSDAQHPHQPQQAHATGADGSTMPGTLPGSVQAPHQGPPFYYYYPSPLYFDQAGAAAPPNLYHPQSFHPQFFAVPNPAYMPNAHSYNQQPPQTASQSDATVMNPQQPPQHQPQVNLRTRDIDTTIE